MRKIRLTRGKYALVDDGDYEFLRQYKWFCKPKTHTFYAATNIQKKGKRYTLYMHQLLVKTRNGNQIDHINWNGLDNRRKNLHEVTHSGNQLNRRPERKRVKV